MITITGKTIIDSLTFVGKRLTVRPAGPVSLYTFNDLNDDYGVMNISAGAVLGTYPVSPYGACFNGSNDNPQTFTIPYTPLHSFVGAQPFSISMDYYSETFDGDRVIYKQNQYTMSFDGNTNIHTFTLYDSANGGSISVNAQGVNWWFISQNLKYTYDGSGVASGLKVYVNNALITNVSYSTVGTFVSMVDDVKPLIVGTPTPFRDCYIDNFAINTL